MPIAVIIGTQLSARVVGRFGPRIMLIIGPSFSVAGMAGLALLHASSGYPLGVALPGAVLTFGIGMSFVPVTLAATTGVAKQDAGLASGLINTTRQIGGSVGLAALVAVATARQHALAGRAAGVAQTGGYARAFLVAAALLVVAVGFAATVLPRRPPAPDPAPVAQPSGEDLPALETA
jgi:MFS family permease